jgi:chromate reductase
MADLKILGICGALRAASTNRLLLEEVKRAFGAADYTDADLRLPLFDEDVEIAEGIPPKVQLLADQVKAADGIVICTPEYNKMIPGVLKNALDWVSRTKGGPWTDKPVAILSAADSRGGGDRSQFSLRLALAPFRVRIAPGPEVLIAQSRQAFDENGRLIDERSKKAVRDLTEAFRREIART